MSKEKLFREFFSLYTLINKEIDKYIINNKNNINEIKEAQKILKGLYNQYDCIKNNVYSIIINGIKNNYTKYSSLLTRETITISEIFSIISDNLKDHKTAYNNIQKIEVLSVINIDNIFINKVKKILNNIILIACN